MVLVLPVKVSSERYRVQQLSRRKLNPVMAIHEAMFFRATRLAGLFSAFGVSPRIPCKYAGAKYHLDAVRVSPAVEPCTRPDAARRYSRYYRGLARSRAHPPCHDSFISEDKGGEISRNIPLDIGIMGSQPLFDFFKRPWMLKVATRSTIQYHEFQFFPTQVLGIPSVNFKFTPEDLMRMSYLFVITQPVAQCHLLATLPICVAEDAASPEPNGSDFQGDILAVELETRHGHAPLESLVFSMSASAFLSNTLTSTMREYPPFGVHDRGDSQSLFNVSSELVRVKKVMIGPMFHSSSND
ncbi:hypothetical protein IW261DRAFT_1423824 [Armillaria novae-zelandiae]|uniref:Uncharacterized protein n=1 Tax=Armillaria novae-zelandiae TaxID=153914 RepID=A0AA39NWA2_9AGAR|nr:hypothetical protein IW261DRAFT_1423824 [Armillaria novae-zelandiae]